MNNLAAYSARRDLMYSFSDRPLSYLCGYGYNCNRVTILQKIVRLCFSSALLLLALVCVAQSGSADCEATLCLQRTAFYAKFQTLIDI
jgi:hypothetical protein